MVVAERFAEAAAAGRSGRAARGRGHGGENRPLKFSYEETTRRGSSSSCVTAGLRVAHSSPTPPDPMRAPRSARQTGDAVPQ